MTATKRIAYTLGLVALLLVIAFMWWRIQSKPPVTREVPVPVAQDPAPQAPPPTYTIEPGAAPALARTEVPGALAELLGSKTVTSLVQTRDFPRRFVATVDNLGRSHAPPALWPVHPVAGRFTVQQTGPGPVISADNGLRYTPLVLMAEQLDAGAAADLYLRMYPLLQREYEALGFPNRHFNHRLMEVIDLLLATPDATYPVQLQFTQVKGPHASERPWVRYEFADPALESLTAGQKMLVRAGPVNQRRIKAQLVALREAIAARAVAR
jgi:hypothetical protein